MILQNIMKNNIVKATTTINSVFHCLTNENMDANLTLNRQQLVLDALKPDFVLCE